ncbi:ABC transporter ATP-binding protein [Heyndrickxia sporothermodurans]|nr:ABC transporter ATP-binding protein [Heyndrickxia sporothermodurans]
MNVLEIHNLSKTYKGKKAVNSLNFTLTEGKCTALLGPNGAGKTTTLNMISGLISPTKGTIQSPLISPNSDVRTIIGYLPQYPSFYDWMSGEEYLNFIGRLTIANKNEIEKRMNELIEIVGLTEGRNRRIGQYSGGMRQRLGIAQALIHQPKLIILDEPVSALDPFGRREVIELMKKLKKDTTILFSTHILNDAEEVCDHVLFLNDGRLIEDDEVNKVQDKHSSNIIRLKFSGNIEYFLKLLEKENWVENLMIKGSELIMHVDNDKTAREKLLKMADEGKWPLVSFEIGRLNLEEIFTKVVRG